jgi:hypothetical protein
MFPMVSPRGKKLPFEKLHSFLRPSSPFRVYESNGNRFSYLRLINYPGYDSSQIDAFQDLGEYSATLHAYHEGLLQEVSISRISDSRNEIMHRLLSLPSAQELDALHEIVPAREYTKGGLQIYEACRTTALLYSIMVTFPLPRSKHSRDTLIPLIKQALDPIEPIHGGDGLCELYLWCVLVAGVSASGYPIRQWFLDQVSTVAECLQVKVWADIEHILESFAWLKCACTSAGIAFWEEVSFAAHIGPIM